MSKFVYSFNESSKDISDILGSKGAHLAEMSQIGLPVPFGFTITTEACNRFYDENQTLAADIEEAIYEKIADMENVSGKTFGDPKNPLLVSVRSGSMTSIPGMMETILNLGLNDESVEGLAALTGNRRFAVDSYRRFIQLFGNAVLGIEKNKFEQIMRDKKADVGVEYVVQLTTMQLEELVASYKELVRRETGEEFPQEPKVQLLEAVKAVFRIWHNESSVRYRKLNGIPETVGTAVNVQTMVFGNMGDASGSGAAFTRNTEDGTKELIGSFLVNAQGEDLEASTRTPAAIETLEITFPEIYKQFIKIAELLEKHYKNVQDIKFTVENNRLYMLQTRSAKRSARAAIKIAVDMVKEGLIDKKTAITRVDPGQLQELIYPGFDPAELEGDFATFMEWADELRELKIRAIADRPEDALQALQLGAEGVGLYRTEQMFLTAERQTAVQKMLLADTPEKKVELLEPLRSGMQQEFKELFRIMGDYPVTVCILDYAHCGFVPQGKADIEALAVLETEAILGAALEVKKEEGLDLVPEILVPMVRLEGELAKVKKPIREAAERLMKEAELDLRYLVGAIIETPRAALCADEVAREADFFSFGTEDLTRMIFGISEADQKKSVAELLRLGILEDDPFQVLDTSGVGKLVKMAATLGRQAKPKLKLGICGQQGGHPKSIEFCHQIGLNSVSCASLQIPAARLAAAQAAVKEGMK